MAEPSAQEPSRPGGLLRGGGGRTAGLWLPAQAAQGEIATPRTLISEGQICIADALLTFTDPGWGEVTFHLYVFRHAGDTLPEYEVVVE